MKHKKIVVSILLDINKTMIIKELQPACKTAAKTGCPCVLWFCYIERQPKNIN